MIEEEYCRSSPGGELSYTPELNHSLIRTIISPSRYTEYIQSPWISGGRIVIRNSANPGEPNMKNIPFNFPQIPGLSFCLLIPGSQLTGKKDAGIICTESFILSPDQLIQRVNSRYDAVVLFLSGGS